MNNLINEITKTLKMNLKSSQNYKNNLLCLNRLLNNYHYRDFEKEINDFKDNIDETMNNTYLKQQIYKDNNYDMYLIYWLKDSASEIHDHTKHGCIFKILKGDVYEEIYDTKTMNMKEFNNYKSETIAYIDNDIGYHKIINNYPGTSVSLHIYSPVEYEANIF
jgi:cysteine dioxygenase